jgi:carbon storage regulator
MAITAVACATRAASWRFCLVTQNETARGNEQSDPGGFVVHTRSFEPANILHGGQTMLVLSRKLGEEIVIDGQIRVKVIAINGNRVKLAFEAPASIGIQRAELCQDDAFAPSPNRMLELAGTP